MFIQKYRYPFIMTVLALALSMTLPAQHIENNGIQVTGGSNMALLGGSTSDMSVFSSMCLGTDCYAGIPFDTSTLLMRENNLRIRFEDSSNSFTFPSWDWELIGNLNTEGSPEEFIIYDATSNRFTVRIKGGTPTNSIVVDANGRLGLGTLTPQQTVHILRPTVRVRLDQNGSMGYAPMTWDLSADATEFALHNINLSNKILRIGAGAPEHSFVLDAAGNSGIGSDQPSEKLHIAGNLKVNGDMSVKGIPIISDLRLKSKIEPLENALTLLNEVNVVSFEYKDEANKGVFPIGRRFGFLAQEVNPFLPELTGKTTIAGKEYQTVDYVSFIPLVLAGVNETNRSQKSIQLNLSAQERIIETQDRRMDELQKELKELKALMAQVQQ